MGPASIFFFLGAGTTTEDGLKHCSSKKIQSKLRSALFVRNCYSAIGSSRFGRVVGTGKSSSLRPIWLALSKRWCERDAKLSRRYPYPPSKIASSWGRKMPVSSIAVHHKHFCMVLSSNDGARNQLFCQCIADCHGAS